jgi:hypothetical protein
VFATAAERWWSLHGVCLLAVPFPELQLHRQLWLIFFCL